MKRRVLQQLRLLIDLLALADQDPDEVQVAKLARPPHMIKRLLASIALAQVECQAVLSGAYFAEDVVVGLPLEQRIANAGVSIVARVVQWRPLAVILGVDVCA